MNEQWALFLAGLLVGSFLCGSIVYEFERVKYLSLVSDYQKAVTEAQNKVITQDKASNTVNANIGAEDEKRLTDVIDKYRAGRLSVPASGGVSKLPKATSKSDAGACTTGQITKLKTQIALRDIQINEWQKWWNQQCKIYTCQ